MTYPKPLQVTETTIDPDYQTPYVIIDEERSEPVPHRYVHGGFEGTEARFSFYFPPAGQYEGRFFHNTYPMAVTSDIGPFPIQFEVAVGDLGFTIDSGAYYVQTNNGGLFRIMGADPAIAAYRVNAAAAKFSREMARKVYGREHRPYGYLFGGSGGAYQTLGAAENTQGVWDGFVPFVPGCDHAIPSMFTARMHALRTLRRRNKLPGIADAVAPGGSGDPYADLNEEEAGALREATLMGWPPLAWYRHATLDSGYFANISGMIPAMDPTYADDFWSQPGYLGGNPSASIHADRYRLETTVAAIHQGPPISVTLADAPTGDVANAHLVVTSGEAAGASLPIASVNGAKLELIAHLDPRVAALKPDDAVRVDNSWALALETYHRHQLPPSESYYGWNQFRGPDGKPLYPQREVLIGPMGTINAAGSMLEGKFSGKMLMLSCLMDIDAHPWQADWYRGQAETAGRSADYALYFVERAHHENPLNALQRANIVSFAGALQQALRDLAAWVEKGEEPLRTVYAVKDTQVLVSDDAAVRKGIQPVIALTANGGERAEVKVGEAVEFTASIVAPPGAGKIVSAEWDFEGTGDYPDMADFAPAEGVTLSPAHAYAKPGTYFAVLRAALQREGDASTQYARVQNLAQVRVVVR
jgi:hypothetical protein